MILDAIIGLFVSLFGSLCEGLAVVFVPLINGIAAALEMLIGLFVSGFRIGRIGHRKDEPQSRTSALAGIAALLAIAALLTWFFVAPAITKQKITLVAKDGHSLPYAALIVHTGEGDRHLRTDNAGNAEIPRFGTTGVTIKDPRYVEKTWSKSEMKAGLVVERTLLGSGLDSLAAPWLKHANE